MVDFSESIFQISKGNYKIALFPASMTDNIEESFSVFIAAWDIVPKSLLKVTFDVLIFSHKVTKSISDDGCEDFRYNRLQRYWTKIGGINIESFLEARMGISCFQASGNSALVHADEMILHKNILRYGHFLSGMTLIWSNERGDAPDFIFIITFVSSLYEGGSRLKLWEGSLKVFIHVGIRKSFFFPFAKTRSKAIWLAQVWQNFITFRFKNSFTVITEISFVEFLVINVVIRDLIFIITFS